jgi:putative DNA primase/helicase
MGKAKALTESEREAIARDLFDVIGDRSGDEIHGLCPFHGDTNPSFSYNIVKDVYNCFTCQKTGDLIRLWSKIRGTGDDADDFKEFCERYGIRIRSDGHGKQNRDRSSKGTTDPGGKKKGKKISHADLQSAWDTMPPLPDRWQDQLKQQRGWTATGISKLQLRMLTRRWDKRTGKVVEIERADRVAIPVFDENGKLCNIRCYKPGAKKLKIFSFAAGLGKARLFPAKPDDGDSTVLIVEGEADVICAVSNGFNAITQTSKTKYWPSDQAKMIAGRDVVIAYDADQPGQKYAVHAAESLVKTASRVRTLEWPDFMGRDPAGEWPKDHGQDLTDFFVKHGKASIDLQKLIDDAHQIENDDLKNACVMDFYDYGPGGRLAFKPRLLADRICNEMSLLCDPESGLMHRWNGSYFERYPDEHVEARCIQLLGDESKQANVRDAVYQSKRLSVLPHGRNMNDSVDWVCLINGMINLRTMEMVPHNKSYYASYQLPISFDPDCAGRCDRFLQYLEETIQTPDPILQAQEFAGYCLTREVRFEKALLLLGPGADGKSKFLTVLENLVGPENCSATSFNDLDNEFHRSSLYGKMLNISTEIGNRAIESAYFKAITSGDPISAAFKHQDTFNFRPYCKLAFAGNRLPRVLDNSDGLFRRLLPISFKRQFLDDGDTQLQEKLLSELSDIFQWALVGLHRLWDQGGFTDCDETRQLLMEHRRANNPVLCFLEDECKIGPKEYTKKTELYRKYKRYADTNGYSIMGRENFFRELYAAASNLKQFRPRTGGERVYWINGIGIIEESNDAE